eukprot:s10394_g1.t1
MGAITSFWGTFSGLTSLTSFSYSCWRRFPRLVRDKVGEIEYKWSMGPGFACMLIATILKLWDAVAHAMLPTPTARQTKPPKGVRGPASTSDITIGKDDHFHRMVAAVVGLAIYGG